MSPTLSRRTFRRAAAAVGTAAALTAVGLAGAPAASAQTGSLDLSELPGSSLPSPSVPFTGTWVDVNPVAGGKITFDNGSVSGTDGCNGIGSTYTVDGNVADVEPFVSTMMACPGPTSDWLQGMSTVHHFGVLLVVHGEDGSVLGMLRPAF